MGDAFVCAMAQNYLAMSYGVVGDPLEGARILGVAQGIHESIGVRPFGTDAARLARVEPGLREAAEEAAFEDAFAQGTGLRWESVLDEILEGWEEGNVNAVVAGSMGSASEKAPDAAPAPGAAAVPEETPIRGAGATGCALRILTLGGFELEGESVEEGVWSYARLQELLLFLL